eukprot:2899218-Lingulodinium_polyedra.AAC.1
MPQSRLVAVPSRPRLSRNTALTSGALPWHTAPSDLGSSAPKGGTLVPGLSHQRMARPHGTRRPTGRPTPPSASPTARGNGPLA